VADTKNVPLAVDLDGTLIRTDMLWESLARRLRQNPLSIFQILFWWVRGRALLKQKLATRVKINPANLPYNTEFLAWLHEEKKAGRKLILATASDLKMAQPLADHVGIFDEVLASNGKTNLRGGNKVRMLTEKFGERGFDYAGNSSVDFKVWRGSREAVVVNASRAVLREAENCAKLGPVFCDNYFPFETAQSFCNELFWRSGYLIAVFAGLLLASAFPNLNFAGFAWIAPALMLFAARGKNPGDAFRVGYVAGISFWLASLYWLLLIPVNWFPILGWFALGAFLALYQGFWLWLVSSFKFQVSSWGSRTLWTLGGAAAWVALEMLRARLFGGFPWSLLGDSQFKLVPLIQIASVTGVYGVSFLVVWFSLALFSAGQMIFQHPTKRFVWQAEIILPLVAVVACFIGGFFVMNREAPTENCLRVTAIQPDIPQSVIWNPSADENLFQKFLAQNRAALTNQTDLVLWPESAVPEMSVENCRLISEFAREQHVWLILNGEDLTTTTVATNYFNAAFLVNPQGTLAGTYHKRQLVIFGEYVPLVRWLPFLQWFTPIVGGWTAGEKAVQFQIKKLDAISDEPTNVIFLNSNDSGNSHRRKDFKIAPLICFEDVFPMTAREAASDDTDLLVNLTNDGWFGNGAAQWQQAAAAVFRTVENGLPLVRCANNGVTCWIDAHGRVQKFLTDTSGDVHGSGALTVEIPIPDRRSQTFYHRHGDWFGWSCVGATIFFLLAKILRR
jgi:apolipoprotein N-acyltransferase